MHVEMNARLVVVQVTVDDKLRWLCTNVAERKATITWVDAQVDSCDRF